MVKKDTPADLQDCTYSTVQPVLYCCKEALIRVCNMNCVGKAFLEKLSAEPDCGRWLYMRTFELVVELWFIIYLLRSRSSFS